MNVSIVYDAQFVAIADLNESSRRRNRLVFQLLRAYGLVATDRVSSSPLAPVVLKPRLASRTELEEFHLREYLDRLLNHHQEEPDDESRQACPYGLDDDCPLFENLGLYVRAIAGRIYKDNAH